MELQTEYLKVKMFNQPEGLYTVQLLDVDGKVLAVKQINHAAGLTVETADFEKKFEGGTYQVELINPKNKKTTETIMLLM